MVEARSVNVKKTTTCPFHTHFSAAFNRNPEIFAARIASHLFTRAITPITSRQRPDVIGSLDRARIIIVFLVHTRFHNISSYSRTEERTTKKEGQHTVQSESILYPDCLIAPFRLTLFVRVYYHVTSSTILLSREPFCFVLYYDFWCGCAQFLFFRFLTLKPI